MTCVGVVISTWNRRDELELVINSVLKQSFKDFKLFIVDNHSVDGTIPYLDCISELYSDCITVVKMPHSNFSAMQTLNIGFNCACEDGCKYILVLDDDAYLSSQHDLYNLVDVMNSNLNAAIVGANVVDTYGRIAMQFKSNDYSLMDIDTLNNFDIFSYIDFSGACALFRSDVCELLGFYDESFFIYWNEADLALKAIASGYDVLYVPRVKPVHLASLTNRAYCRNLYYYIRNGNYIINNNLGLRERLVLIPMRTVVFFVSYLRECPVTISMIVKMIKMSIISILQIFFMERRMYTSEKKHLWVRGIYSKFFWRNLYYSIFNV